MQAKAVARWRVKGAEMEGLVARWYARIRGTESKTESCRQEAGRLTGSLPAGARVFEVALGPGYLSIQLARLGRFQVSGLDISRTFVKIASQNARDAGVTADFHQGDAAVMPFDSDSFDLIVCQAAFKNFVHPGSALSEMHRVLRGGGIPPIPAMSTPPPPPPPHPHAQATPLARVSPLT